jgi:DNA-binding NarL/FixJ family response regulator
LGQHCDVVVLATVRVVGELVAGALARDPSIRVREAGTSPEMLAEWPDGEHPRVLVYDGSTTTAVLRLRAAIEILGANAVVVFGLAEQRDDLRRCAELKVRGLVERSAPLAELVDAIRAVARHDHFQSPSLVRDMIELVATSHSGREPLTDRERQVAELMMDGYSNSAIAAELRLRPGTLKTHINAIFRKYAVHTRAQFSVMYAGRRRATLDGDGPSAAYPLARRV